MTISHAVAADGRDAEAHEPLSWCPSEAPDKINLVEQAE
jgi:hypothetical protein